MKKPRNESAGQVVPLETRALAKPSRVAWRAFNRFVNDADALRQYYHGLTDLLGGRAEDDLRSFADVTDDAELCRELVARCKAGLDRFDHADNYEQHDGGGRVLSHAHVAKRIGILVASFPNANPTDAEGYVQMLVEHVAAVEGLTEIALESACREIVENQKFVPAIAEVLKVIDRHVEIWWNRRFAIRESEARRLELIAALDEREKKAKQEAHEREVQQAINRVKFAMRTKQHLVKQIEAKTQEIENKKAELAALVEQHAGAEQRESEFLRKLRKLTASEEERETEAAHKLDGHSCGELPLGGTVHSRSPAAEAEGPHPPRAPAPMAAPLPGLCDGPLGPGTSPAP